MPTPMRTENTRVRVASSIWFLPWNWKNTNKLPKNMLSKGREIDKFYMLQDVARGWSEIGNCLINLGKVGELAVEKLFAHLSL
jgi:hypothetical protein